MVSRALELYRRVSIPDDHPHVAMVSRALAALAGRGPGPGGSAPGSVLYSDEVGELADLGDVAKLKWGSKKPERRKRRNKA